MLPSIVILVCTSYSIHGRLLDLPNDVSVFPRQWLAPGHHVQLNTNYIRVGAQIILANGVKGRLGSAPTEVATYATVIPRSRSSHTKG